MSSVKPIISIIVPVFNAEKYLRQCLDSVVRQPIDLELICVDDGSTDNSRQIIEEYVKKDPRVKLLVQDNKHAGVARNYGLSVAGGGYVHFLDADDWVEPIYDQWVAIAKDQDADVCICQYKWFDNVTKKITPRTRKPTDKYISCTNFTDNEKFYIYSPVVPWNKIYRTDFLRKNNIKFDDLICANDRSFYFDCITKATNIVHVNEFWLNYRVNNKDSLVGTTRLANYEAHFKSFDRVWNIFESYPNDVKSLVLDVSLIDFFNFYRRSIGTVYEDKISKQISNFLSHLNLEQYFMTLKSKSWYADYVMCSASAAERFVQRRQADYIKQQQLLAEELNKLNSELLSQKKLVLQQQKEILKLKEQTTSVFHFVQGIRQTLIYKLLRKCKHLQDNLVSQKTLETNTIQRVIKKETSLSNQEERNPTTARINKNYRNEPLIVSLTSYPARIDKIAPCLKSILNQSIKADKVILWLAESEFPQKESSLPEEILALTEQGLEIKWCENYRSYKKLIPALLMYPEAVIVTADDDAIYGKDWLKQLYDSYLQCNEKMIHCHRITKVFCPDNRFHIISASKSLWSIPTYLHKLTGLGGVLYPPHSLHEKVLDPRFLTIAPTNDDLWFWAMAVMNGVRIKSVKNATPCPELIKETQTVALTNINDRGEQLFWKDFDALLSEFPIFKETLETEYLYMKKVERFSKLMTKADENFWKDLVIEDRKIALLIWYYRRTGDYLNLDHPISFNEKIQWSKLFQSTDLKTKLADKYEVREWVKEKIGADYLVPIYGVWDKFEEIDFDDLPKQFVLKTNHGSGMNLIVTDKDKLNLDVAKDKFTQWLNRHYGLSASQELHYLKIKPKIIAEEFIAEMGDLPDYKFFCLDGKVEFVWVDTARFTDHRRDFFDLNWNHLNVTSEYKNADQIPQKPKHFEEMLKLAETLSQGMDQVRVDLYETRDKVYFGEMTFTSGNGADHYDPISFNVNYGKKWKLPKPIPFVSL